MVPLGSVLGPLLFVLFINDLLDGMKHHIKLYADDSKIICVINSNKGYEDLQQDINVGVVWGNIWLMRFNINKCKVLHLGKNNDKRSNLVYSMKHANGISHELTETVLERDLGVLISQPQVEAAAFRANRAFGVYKLVFLSRSNKLW